MPPKIYYLFLRADMIHHFNGIDMLVFAHRSHPMIYHLTPDRHRPFDKKKNISSSMSFIGTDLINQSLWNSIKNGKPIVCWIYQNPISIQFAVNMWRISPFYFRSNINAFVFQKIKCKISIWSGVPSSYIR